MHIVKEKKKKKKGIRVQEEHKRTKSGRSRGWEEEEAFEWIFILASAFQLVGNAGV